MPLDLDNQHVNETSGEDSLAVRGVHTIKHVVEKFNDINDVLNTMDSWGIDLLLKQSRDIPLKVKIYVKHGFMEAEEAAKALKDAASAEEGFVEALRQNKVKWQAIKDGQAAKLEEMFLEVQSKAAKAVEALEGELSVAEGVLEGASETAAIAAEQMATRAGLAAEEAANVAEAAQALSDAQDASALEELLAPLRQQLGEAEGAFAEGARIGEGLTAEWKAAQQGAATAEEAAASLASRVAAYDGVEASAASAQLLKDAVKATEEGASFLAEATAGMKRAQTAMFDGYSTYIKSFVTEGDALSYAEKVLALTKEKSALEIAKAKGLASTVQNMVKAGATAEEIYAETAAWASPSFRLFAATMDEFEAVRAMGLSASGIIGGVRATVNGAVRMTGAAGLGFLEEALGAIAGRIGSRVAMALGEGAMLVGGVIAKALAFVGSLEVQAVLFIGYSLYDAFNAHNKKEWVADLLDVIPFMSFFYDTDYQRIQSYKRASHDVYGTELDDPETSLLNIHRFESEDEAFMLDYWGKLYIDEMNKTGAKMREYVPMTKFKGIMRVPGKYIYDDDHSLDGENRYERCQQLERDLLYGNLVDEKGRLSARDKGGHLVSAFLPIIKGAVRNLVDFPLYANTVHWPSLGGTAVMIAGQWGEDQIDYNIVETFKTWASTGRHGPIFTGTTVEETRQVTQNTNLQKRMEWLFPSRTHEFAWTSCNRWIEGNMGMQNLYATGMEGVRLVEFEKEYNTHKDAKHVPWYAQIFTSQARGEWNYDTQAAVEDFFENTGRYPCDIQARKFYRGVINDHEVKYMDTHLTLGFRISWRMFYRSPFLADSLVTLTRPATPQEITKYTIIFNDILRYHEALATHVGDNDAAWEQFTEDMTWDNYIRSTKHTKTDWGWTTYIKDELKLTLQDVTSHLLGDRKDAAWQAYIDKMAARSTPLNMNSYNRAVFMGELNKYIYAAGVKDLLQADKSIAVIENLTGAVVEEFFITTGVQEGVSGFETAIKNVAHVIRTKDIPSFFGDIHCRILYLEEPKPTVLVVFRGTKVDNVAQWAMNFDFTSSVSMKVVEKQDGIFELVEAGSSRDTGAFAVHRGFLRAWKALRFEVFETLQYLYDKFDIRDVLVTGHSLGAAIAQVACLEIPSVPVLGGITPYPRYRRPHCYYFSSPLVGNASFEVEYQRRVSESVHCYIDGDVVTMMPPFLIPHQESSSASEAEQNKGDALSRIDGEDGGVMSGALGMIQFMVADVGQLPKIVHPYSWVDKNGKPSISKVMANLGLIADAANNHRAHHGGGLFIRLSNKDNGGVYESTVDPGVTETALKTLGRMLDRPATVLEYHSIDNVVEKLKDLAALHPELIGGTEMREIPSFDLQDDPPPPPIPEVTISPTREMLKDATVLGTCRVVGNYAPFQIVPHSAVIRNEYSPLPDHLQELADDPEELLERRRKRIRRTMAYNSTAGGEGDGW